MTDRADAARALAAAASGASEGGQAAAGTDAPPEATEAVSGAHSGASGDDPDRSETGKLRREAAGYRTRLRDTEAERDSLRARVDRQDREAVERIAAERMTGPADLWLDAELTAMRDQDGGLDPELVRAEIDRVLSARPHWRKGPPDFGAGARPPAEAKPGFGAALKRAVTGER